MNDTGRIQEPVCATARRIVFGSLGDNRCDEMLEVLRLSSDVDRAHLVMLVRRGIARQSTARRLLLAIEELARTNFEPLVGRPATRGAFLLYEDYLVERCGPECGGVLQTGRSRNDLNATVFRLRLRRSYLEIVREFVRFGAVLIRRAARYSGTVMPAYSHYQPAMPSTFGHYLAGFAFAAFRDATWLMDSCAHLHECPLGAAAGAGTSWPIDPGMTASLLGFRSTARHSGDAVSSRDLALRLMSAIAISGVTLSRIATDMLMWSTMEFGFLHLDDAVVGSSSVMPQKRNPFLLEHVVGKAGVLSGYFQSGLTAIHAAPFSNSIAVGAEGVRPIWSAANEFVSCLTLIRLVLAHAKPRSAQMLNSAVSGATTATSVADYLVRRRGLDFRSAHKLVGTVVRKAVQLKGSFPETARDMLGIEGDDSEMEALFDPVESVSQLTYGNGPAPAVITTQIEDLTRAWREFALNKRSVAHEWSEAASRLNLAVGALTA